MIFHRTRSHGVSVQRVVNDKSFRGVLIENPNAKVLDAITAESLVHERNTNRSRKTHTLEKSDTRSGNGRSMHRRAIISIAR